MARQPATTVYAQAAPGQTVAPGQYGHLTFNTYPKTLPNGGTVAVQGNFDPGAGGGHTVAGSTVAFDGAGAQTIANAVTLHNVTVGDGVTLTTAAVVAVNGTLNNAGWTRETRPIGGAGALAFGLAGLTVDVGTPGGLSRLDVVRRDQNHPQATGSASSGTATGRYWAITPVTTTAAAFSVTLALPHALGASHAQAQVCRYDGPAAPGAHWNCARTASDAASVWRAGVAHFSEWAAGANVSPTAIRRVGAGSGHGGASLLGAALLALGAAGLALTPRPRERRRGIPARPCVRTVCVNGIVLYYTHPGASIVVSGRPGDVAGRFFCSDTERISERHPMLKLAVFDLDGTLKVEPDPYVYLHRRLGVMAEAAALTAAGLSGQLVYEDWLRADAELWRGTPRARLLELFAEDAYIPGAPEAVRALQAHGAEIAILSSGLRLHAEMVAADLGIAHVFGNEIFFDGGDDPAVTGAVKATAPIHSKGELLAQLQAELDIWRTRRWPSATRAATCRYSRGRRCAWPSRRTSRRWQKLPTSCCRICAICCPACVCSSRVGSSQRIERIQRKTFNPQFVIRNSASYFLTPNS
jgi:HAD superfamily phosphoserine phosphatase-like hydrolase